MSGVDLLHLLGDSVDLFSKIDQTFNFCVLDTETTGLDFRVENLLEVACIKCGLSGGKILKRNKYHSLIGHDNIEIPEHITAMTGINVEDLVGAPKFNDISNFLLENYLSKRPIFAHNAEFDALFLCKYDLRFLSLMYIDTAKMARALLPGLVKYGDMKPYRQIRLQELFGIKGEDAHDAANDVEVLLSITCNLLGLLTVRDDLILYDFIIKRNVLEKQLVKERRCL